MFKYDVLVVGCGLSGAVVARELAENGKRVCIWEARNHIAGNMFDYKDEHGILVHKYGPHVFHTNKKEIHDYVQRFGAWHPYKLICMTNFLGKTTPTPFNFQTIEAYFSIEKAAKIKAAVQETFQERETVTVVEALQSKNPLVKEYAEFLFKHDYSLYTAKQWGVSPSEIDSSVLKRVPLRFSNKTQYFDDTYEMLPETSYESWFQNLLAHPNITVMLEKSAKGKLTLSAGKDKLLLEGVPIKETVVYTGALDELFCCVYGALPYRSLRFDWKHEKIESLQEAALIAYPEATGYTRITEYKKLPCQNVDGTTYAVEYPLTYQVGKQVEPYYPVLTDESQALFAKYEKIAQQVDNLYCCGRLADFKYYNMDQALERALAVSKMILQKDC